MKRFKILIGLFLFVILFFVVVVNVTPQPIVSLASEVVFDILDDSRPAQYEVYGVNVTTDIEYASAYGSNTFDYYEARPVFEKPSTVIWVHGGGFIGGDKSDVEGYAVWLAHQGYNVVSMNYALAPEAVYPSMLLQVNELVEYVKQNMGLDTMFFAGDSAGAQIAAQYVMVQTNETYAEKIGLEPNLSSEQIKGTLLFCGIYDTNALLETDSQILNFIFKHIGWSYLGTKEWQASENGQLMSIIDHIDENFPATYVTDGNAISFEEQSMALVEKMKSLNIEVTSRFFDKEEVTTYHGYQFKLATDAALQSFEEVIYFLDTHRD